MVLTSRKMDCRKGGKMGLLASGIWQRKISTVNGKPQNMECELCWFPTAKRAKEYAQELVEVGAT